LTRGGGTELRPVETTGTSDTIIAGGQTMRDGTPPRTPDRHHLTPNRREVLRLAAAGAAAGLAAPEPLASVRQARRPAKRVVVAGAGIGGLCCAYELMERGHDVTVLEAAGRPGGHVRTIHDPLPDGLYADVGAEHFTRPRYDHYWK
jgi:NADPH-dependent 2,4-dienoyl-CoA reductase/sulfur reductase-like enzyme